MAFGQTHHPDPTEPDKNMAFRMADYRLRVFRRFPQKQMRQVVIYLRPSDSPLVHQTYFEIPGTRHEFEVVRLWEQPTNEFLNAPGLLPLAVLTQTRNPEQTLRQVAEKVATISEIDIQSNVAATTAILAGLSLEREFIHQVLRRDIMQQSVIYQEWREEFLAEGLQRGRQEGLKEGLKEGRQEEGRSLIIRQLTHRFGGLTPEMRSNIESLSLSQLENLGEALLDFSELADLEQWLSDTLS